MEKPKGQVEREETYLRCIKLCEHNLQGRCNPKDGRLCNFAHWLSELRAPNEGEGDWWKTLDKGDVDIRFWAEYVPNLASQHRPRQPCFWERNHYPKGIPNWAWGHAMRLGYTDSEEIPAHVPHHFDWPLMQKVWHEQKRRGKDTAICVRMWGLLPLKLHPHRANMQLAILKLRMHRSNMQVEK